MPNKKSASKALRQSEKRSVRNRNVKDSITYGRRMLRKAMESNDIPKAQELAKSVVKGVDKAVQNKVVKKNTGSRIKSRTVKALNRLVAEPKGK
ncbi:30S ribosomal protein S20 [Candidatus Uhrbacteria bacterium]|nr:30S ribosomal protein S20 [Candidatus Uhrbacteria bacterium]